MKSGKHILFFTPGFPRDENDGSCLPTVQNFIRCFHLLHPEWKITVLSLHYPFEARSYRWNDIEVIALGGRNRAYPSRFLLWQKAIRKLRHIHAQQPVDIIHSFWMHECAMLGGFFSRRKKVPMLITLMGQDLRPPNPFVRFIDQHKATLVVLSEFQPERSKTGIRPPDAVIPFGIPSGEKDGLLPSEKTVDVIGIGSLIPLKNYELFLKVIAHLKKDMPGITAEIVGEGIDRPHIEYLIKELDLEQNVKLCGQLSREEIYRHLGRSRVLLHTSTYETQGYVFNEALLAGVPIVSTAVGIAREASYWKLGSDVESLAAGVRQFLNHPVEVSPEANHWMETTVEAYEALYRRSLMSRATMAATKK